MHTPAGPPVARRRARVLYCVVIATLVSGLGITIAAQNKVRPLPVLALPSVSLSLSLVIATRVHSPSAIVPRCCLLGTPPFLGPHDGVERKTARSMLPKTRVRVDHEIVRLTTAIRMFFLFILARLTRPHRRALSTLRWS